MPYRLRFVLFFVLASFSCDVLLAHKDRGIQLKDDKLIGLPTKYTPAEFNSREFRIRIKDHVMTFSPFLKSLFDEPHDLDISASWYHDTDLLPPYLCLRIRPKNKDFSYGLLLNLDTLDLIELYVTLRESESSERHLPIALSETEKQDIRKSIRKAK